jgi:predicted O-linked N-acetylglucosamine transferase (SPINDLY family)
MDNFNALLKKGFEYHKENNFKEALKIYKKLVSLDNTNPQLKLFLGTLYLQIEDYQQAENYLKQSLDIDKNNTSIINNLAATYEKLNKKDKALKLYLRSIDISKNNPETFFRIANLFLNLKNYELAIENYQKAINLNPNFINAYMNLGNLLSKKKTKEALNCYDIITKLDDKNLNAYLNKGNIYLKLENYTYAIKNFEKVLEINPSYNLVLGKLLFAKIFICDWKNFNKLLETIIKNINDNLMVIHPSIFLSISDRPDLHLKATKIYINENFKNINNNKAIELKTDGKINIGYFSSDFYDHATLRLMMDVFKYHDKSKFNIFGFSCGPKKNDVCTQKLITYLDNHFYVGDMDLDQILTLCKKININIAIDLKGYSKDNQIDIFEKRVAPIQISYLGYPGTTGIKNMDYILADKIIIPKENYKFYSEKVLHLPDCYQPNEKNKTILKNKKTKNDFGLDINKFIFCSFNTNYKITPDIFDIWMEILKKTPNSILWILVTNETAKKNLLLIAKKNGINFDRIVFAEYLKESEHLDRIKFADLFLDTFPCNAHTTASEVVRMGVPIVTIEGKSFASRVAASILHQFKLDDLVMKNKEDYRNKAIELYKHPEKLNSVKKKIINNIEDSLLFDTKKLTSNLEKIYLDVINKIN